MIAACAWSLVRSLLVAILAAPICLVLERRLSSLRSPVRRIAWGVVVAPFLFPTLLSGYAWSGASLRLVNSAAVTRLASDWPAETRAWLSRQNDSLDELLLGLMLLAKGVPVGTMVLAFAPPPPYSAAAWHCRGLLRARRTTLQRIAERLAYARYGPLRSVLAAAGLVFLVSFQEFELPALLGRPAWTAWLFARQFEGLQLSESLRAALLPVICQIAVVVPLWRGLVRNQAAAPALSESENPGRAAGACNVLYLAAAVLAAIILPLGLIGRDTLDGFRALFANRIQLERTVREIVVGVFLSGLAAVFALRLAETAQKNGLFRRSLAWLAFPAFFGPLVLGLTLVRLFQWPLFNAAYRTPFSFLLGIVLFLLPRAMLLGAVAQATVRQQARHAAALLAGATEQRRRSAAHELQWHLGGRARFWSVALLTYWGYLELTIASLVGAEAIVSVPVLLYNQMHTGKNAILSAQTCLAVGAPAALFLGAAALRPVLSRWFWR